MKTHTNFQATTVKQCCFFFIGAILLCSCSHVYYSPNSSNVPLFQKKGEIRLSGNYCVGNTGSDEITGGEIQAAYAAGDHVGILLNTAFMGVPDDNTSQYSSGSGSIIEMGAGYFKPLKKNHVFETYAGLGFGNVKNHYSSGGNSRVNFTKFFLQPSIGYSRKYFHAGIASKLSLVNMKVDLPNGHNSIEPYEMEGIEYITAKPLSVLWEPSFFIRAGVKAVKAQFQFTPSLNLNNKDLAQNEALFSMGISIAIDAVHAGK